ncbi:MAG: hypothetical protein Kow00124_19320 [Anaerolineae bacterium]
MNLRQYRWFQNPRGLQNDGPFRPFYPDRYTMPRLGWAGLQAGADEYVDAAARLVAQQVMPVVRITREHMAGTRPPDEWWDYYQHYIRAGCLWFELYSEPNLDHEWPVDSPALPLNWVGEERCIRPLMDHWLEWAEGIIDLGGYPAFPAMADTTVERQATVMWLDACLYYLRDTHAERFRRVIVSGLWLATHPNMLNHFYQEPPGGPPYAARPYYQQRADEAGWHFEYPYDPLAQRLDPGRTSLGGTETSPNGDPFGLTATGDAFQRLLKRHFNAGPVPVLGTAGGIRPPRPGDAPLQPDRHYPPYSHENYSEAVLGMWRWIARQGPPWFFGITLSGEREYYERPGGPSPLIARLAAEAPVLKHVPDIPVSGGPDEGWGEEMPFGPPLEEPVVEPPAIIEVRPSAAWSVVEEPPLYDDEVEEAPAYAVEMEQPAPVVEEAPTPAVTVEEPALPAAEGEELPPETVSTPQQRSARRSLLRRAAAASSTPTVTGAASPSVEQPAPSEDGLPGGQAARTAFTAADADLHWLIMAPDVPAEWWLAAGRRYWDAFHPAIITSPALTRLVPPGKKLALTLIVTERSRAGVEQALRRARPDMYYDLIVAGSASDLREELDRRAYEGRRFG